ncbi:hypothetical protein ACU639_04555 [Streptomyces cynarae]|uniref:hypothetical protein n=1 Tax=Streptomyces cynarae TaxID=2981134 RepID=UPI00406C0A6D
MSAGPYELGEVAVAGRCFDAVKPTARPRSPKPQHPALLTALITTEAGTMHPIYRRLADHAGHYLPQQADSAWADTVKILHDHYRAP